MKLLLVLLAAGLCTSYALPAKQLKAVAVNDDVSDLIKVVEELMKDGIDTAAKDLQQFVGWLNTEFQNIQPEIEKAEEAVGAVAQEVLADVVEFNHEALRQALLFVGSHSQQIHDIYGLVKDAMSKIDSGDTAGLEKDIEAIVGDLESILKDLAVVIKGDAQEFLQWLGQKWEALKPVLDSALVALETLGHDFMVDLATELQTLLKTVADFFEAHKDLFTEGWQDILHILKTLGVPVHDITDLTPAIQDAEQIAKILQDLATAFEPTAEADAKAFIDWAKQEYQKIQPTIQADLEVLKALGDELLTELEKVTHEEIDDAVQFYKDNTDAVNAVFTDIVNGIHALEKGDASTAEKDFEDAAAKGKVLLEKLAVILKKRVEEFIAWAKEEWTKVKADLEVLFTQLQALAQDFFQELQDAATVLQDQLQKFIKDHQDQVTQLNALFQKFLQDLGLAS